MSAHRKIVVGIGGRGAVPVIRWAADMARAGDTVRIVHAYARIPYAASDWTLPVETDEVMHGAAARHVTDVARVLRAERHDLNADGPVIDAAMSEATLRRAPLVVLRPWQPTDAAELLFAETEEQKLTDQYLADWSERYPQVGVIVELRLGGPVTVVEEYGNRSELLVIGHAPSDALQWTDLDEPVDAAIRTRSGPTLIIGRSATAYPAAIADDPVEPTTALAS